jgi:hypothetical protein
MRGAKCSSDNYLLTADFLSEYRKHDEQDANNGSETVSGNTIDAP